MSSLSFGGLWATEGGLGIVCECQKYVVHTWAGVPCEISDECWF